MMTSLARAILLSICCGTGGAAVAEGGGGQVLSFDKFLLERGLVGVPANRDGSPILFAGCCKTCTKGKACGNSCISK